MSVVSTAPAAKAALVGLLRNHADLAGVSVTYGTPARVPTDQWVRVGEIRIEQRAAVLNPTRLPRDEEYDVEVDVIVRRGTDAQQLATERAFDLAGGVERGVRSDPTLGGVVFWAVVTRMDLVESEPDASSRLAELTVVVSCKARVQGP